MDYCRVDFANGVYMYLENNVQTFGEKNRAEYLMKKLYRYKRIKRMYQIPPNKEINHLYIRTKS